MASVHTETRHVEHRKPGIRQEKEITTTTVVDPAVVKGKSYAEAAGAPHHSNAGSKRRASFSDKAQQLMPNVTKQQLAYGLPVVLAILLSLLFLGFRSSSYFQPPPPPTLTQQFANKLDSLGSNIGGDYWESLKHKTSALHSSASDLVDSLKLGSMPGMESLMLKAEELKAEADKQYKAANLKASEYAAQAKKASAAGAAKVNAKVDGVKDHGADAYNRAGLHGQGVAEQVKHAVNEASEAVRHAAAETQEAVRHKAAEVQNSAQHKAQDVKDTYHNIKDTIKAKVGL